MNLCPRKAMRQADIDRLRAWMVRPQCHLIAGRAAESRDRAQDGCRQSDRWPPVYNARRWWGVRDRRRRCPRCLRKRRLVAPRTRGTQEDASGNRRADRGEGARTRGTWRARQRRDRLHGFEDGMDRALTCIDESVIDRLIDREQARFRETHPRSAEAWARGREHFLYGGPSHWMRRWAGGFPVYVASAKGAHITDIDGKAYVDFCLGDTGGMCGHGPEPVTVAAAHQLANGASSMLPTEDSLWVGEELARRFMLPYWTLTTSATDANRAAIRMARMITGRAKVLVFSGCYHGGVEEAHVELVAGEMRLRKMIHANG